MEQLGHAPQTKDEGLREMQRRGWVLVDATYEPVDGLGRQNKRRDGIILRDYPLLVATLNKLSPTNASNHFDIRQMCKLLDGKLTADGFKVIKARPSACRFRAMASSRNFTRSLPCCSQQHSNLRPVPTVLRYLPGSMMQPCFYLERP